MNNISPFSIHKYSLITLLVVFFSNCFPISILAQSVPKPANESSAKDYEALVNLALEQVKNKDVAKAIESCSQAIRLKNDRIEAYFVRGMIYSKTRYQPKDALDRMLTPLGGQNNHLVEADFTKCVEIAPKFQQGYLYLGMVQVKTKPYDEMALPLKNLDEAIRLNPNDPSAYYFRAEANRQNSSFTKAAYGELTKEKNRIRSLALADYTKYINLAPASDAMRGYLGRGQAYFEIEKFDLAIADTSRFIEKNTENEDAYLVRGRSYLELKKDTQAVEDLTKAIGIHESHDNDSSFDMFRIEVYQARAEAFGKLGKKKEAKADEDAAKQD